jgi:hypothetical protein
MLSPAAPGRFGAALRAGIVVAPASAPRSTLFADQQGRTSNNGVTSARAAELVHTPAAAVPTLYPGSMLVVVVIELVGTPCQVVTGTVSGASLASESTIQYLVEGARGCCPPSNHS